MIDTGVGNRNSQKNCSYGINNFHWKKNECFFPNSYVNQLEHTREVLNETIIDVSGDNCMY